VKAPLTATSRFALFVFLVCRLTSGVFTINSSTPILKIILNEHPIFKYNIISSRFVCFVLLLR
jgi:hypothetical protein